MAETMVKPENHWGDRHRNRERWPGGGRYHRWAPEPRYHRCHSWVYRINATTVPGTKHQNYVNQPAIGSVHSHLGIKQHPALCDLNPDFVLLTLVLSVDRSHHACNKSSPIWSIIYHCLLLVFDHYHQAITILNHCQAWLAIISHYRPVFKHQLPIIMVCQFCLTIKQQLVSN